MHHFATQLRPGQQATRSLRTSQYSRSTKRKRNEDDEEPPISPDGDSTSLPAIPNSQPALSSIPPESVQQLRVAGLLPEDEGLIPPSPFPHASAGPSSSHFNSTKVQKELAGLRSPLFALHPTSKFGPGVNPSESSALKQTHLDVLSTILHRCLLEGDYDRAGRSWGMILRTHAGGGRPIDPRNHGRWGIGAEILLHHRNPTERNHGDGDQNTTQLTPDHVFSEEGFELAREYYERLILQYPHRKQHPRNIDERTFYPAMFSLWIYEVCEKSKRARRRPEPKARWSSMSTEGDTSVASTEARTREDAIQAVELASATEIAERLGQLIVSPPFDKDANLLRLRGMVSLWMSDLIIGEQPKKQEEDWSMDEHSEVLDSPIEKRSKIRNCQREVELAEAFFQRAEENGAGRQTRTMSNTDVRLKELATRLARLEAE